MTAISRDSEIRRNSPTLGDEEAAAAAAAVRSGWIARGAQTAAFEEEFCALHELDAGHAVAVSSGTAALFLALWALDAKSKRVALPSYACQSLMHAARAAGAQPIPVDTPPGDDPNIDLEAVNASGAELAIVAHVFGIPADVRAVNIPVIEDCAQALGAAYDGLRAGLRGSAAVFSFGPTKMITAAGAGGMVLSKDRRLIDTIRDYLNYYDRDDDRARFNFEFTDVQAAVGRIQLRRLEEFRRRREELFGIYKRAGLALLGCGDSRAQAVRTGAIILTDDLQRMIAHLARHGIPARTPLTSRHLLGSNTMNAIRLTERALSLPIYPLLDDCDAEFIVETVNGFRP